MPTGDDDMKRITLEFVSDGFRDLLCSEPVKEQVETAAERIAGGRWIAYVAADTKPAVWDAIYNHRLETVIWEANQ